MLNTLVIVALQDSRKVFSFLLTNWLRIPWFFSRGRTRLAFSFFLTYNFFFFPWSVIRDTFIFCSWQVFFFLVPWILVDIRLVNIYIHIYISLHNSCYVRIRDVDLKTCQRRWTIGRSGERGLRISVLAARHDIYIYIYIY